MKGSITSEDSTNIIFFNQNYLIQRETVAALRRLPGARVVAVDIVPSPSGGQAQSAARVLEEQGCSILVTVNEWGMDAGGVLWEYLDRNKIVHVNWSADDPFYEGIMKVKKYRPSRLRFDFVSDKGYVKPMLKRGYKAYFLPLATDLELFNPGAQRENTWDNDIVFVGNSYTKQMDGFLKIAPEFIDTLAPFLGEVVQRYDENVEHDVEGHLAREVGKIRLPHGLSFEKAYFIAKHAAGYFGRKRMIRSLIERYPGFRVYGEQGWLQELPDGRLGTVKYYDTLCAVYRRAKITIDINRMVIRNGFTQRAFDVPASGGFLITSAKPVVYEYFVTSGPAREIAVFRSRKELIELVDYYLAHEDERLAIAQRGLKKVVTRHTYDHRIAEMFRVISQELKSPR
ncbi:MAG: glycosyltransferase [Chitinispirillaceae bacterium]|nr:glycosyltransferase [Chitinispirillaceae bacterium]